MKPVPRWLLVTLLIVWIPFSALAQSRTKPGPDAATYNTQLKIGPVPGLTTAWHPAPTETAVPLGATLQFMAKGTRPEAVEWTGAREISRSGTSIAECRLTTPGPHTVTMTYTDSSSELRQESSLLNVIDTSVFPITFSAPRLRVDPVVVDENSSNETTMRYFFGDSIAALREISEGHYLTSTNRWIHLEVDVAPSSFAPLVEWRLNGRAQKDLGTAILMQVFPPRQHSIEVGSADNPQAAMLETYRVRITSHESMVDDIPEYSPVTFTAVTDPPGYEDEITWLASTKYGSCDPVMGHGPEFIVSFQNTFGANGGRWLGVKADNSPVAKDEKGSAFEFRGFRCLRESEPIPEGEQRFEECRPTAPPVIADPSDPGSTSYTGFIDVFVDRLEFTCIADTESDCIGFVASCLDNDGIVGQDSDRDMATCVFPF